MSELIKRGQEIVSAAPQLYIDVDIEADGKPGYGSMLSIGAVTPDGDIYYVELKPSSEVYVSSQRKFCEEHGLKRERLMKEGVSSKTAMQDFNNWTKYQAERANKTPRLAAFNAGFDFAHIDLEFTKNKIKNPYGIAPLCLKSLAQVIVPGWDFNKTAKAQLPTEIQPVRDFTHNALEDAIYQQHVHFGLAAIIEGMQQRRNNL